jgi:alpha-L-rhamnosidase
MIKKQLLALVFVCGIILPATAQTWIWYPGDYEMWLGNKMNNHRTDRGAFFPPFWKQDSHYVTVEFSKTVELVQPETITIATEGKYNIKLDGKMQFGMPSKFTLPAGKHHLNIKVHNQATPPALYVDGTTIKSGSDWKVTYEDKEWIDESGKASDTSTTLYMDAGSWNFNDINSCPSAFTLKQQPQEAIAVKHLKEGTLYDFGKETFGYPVLHHLSGNGTVHIYYGESPEEAQDKAHCETLDKIQVENGQVIDLATNNRVALADSYTLGNSKAFRYIYIETEGSNCSLNNVSMQYEYMPETYKGSFRCNDEEINKMWNVGAYTLQLTTREFFIDGIKRDRWVWSGDAVQSYLMNYYLFFDNDEVKRTTWLLGGKPPVTSHINTIMDYTFYWFIGIYNYYLYSGDKHFVQQIYPRMQSLMQYVLGRTDADGMVEGQAGDWVFVDWADGYLDKHGQLSLEQVLFCRSLETMATCARLSGDKEAESKYTHMADALRAKLIPYFWNEQKKALVHNRIDGKQSTSVTRYANMFAILFDYLNKDQQNTVKKSVLLNDSIMHISTPYMRFYELESLCDMGQQSQVLKEMKAYWGGMLREGATTFWEKYNPDEHGTQHLAMYGRPYGKSLCHAWGASPLYLLGKYYLGVQPTKPGYEEYEVKPVLGGLKWMEGSVPTPYGLIKVKMTKSQVTVSSDGGKGTLVVTRKGKIEHIAIPVGKELTVKL